jgi:hypothetical protein
VRASDPPIPPPNGPAPESPGRPLGLFFLGRDLHSRTIRRSVASQATKLGESALEPISPKRLSKNVHDRPPQEELIRLAEACLLEAERTLDSEVAEMLLLRAERYLQEARQIMATRRRER